MAVRTLNISLPEELRDLVVREVASGGYGSVSEFVREAVRDSLRRAALDRLEALALEGLATPEVEATPALWRSIRERARRADRSTRRR
ncbi:MAG: ribbon-helix-helix protein, CopG family [Planctomycetaceae bacterium]|nr:ribbon-helix-helix domain-containing protein [Planctomycetota bacterium]NUN51942.1 ribbon-helix-helix protein, CopG family [Planctomycetaceae bacterium]